MRQQEVLNKIGSILNELNEQYEYLKPLPVPLDDLELELLNANANFLADHIEILRKLNTALEKGNQAMKTVPDVESLELRGEQTGNTSLGADLTSAELLTFAEHLEKPAAEDIAYLEEEPENTPSTLVPETLPEDSPVPHIDLGADTGRDHFSFIRSTEPEIIRHDFDLNEAGTFNDDENKPHEETVAEALAHIEGATEHIEEPAPQEEEEKPLTLNERIAAQNSNLPQTKTEQPITDLKAAINLNDKMLFVRDLFNGYSLAYSEAIEILNRFNKLEDAERFLSVNYEEKNNWAGKPATRGKFYNLLKRRFA